MLRLGWEMTPARNARLLLALRKVKAEGGRDVSLARFNAALLQMLEGSPQVVLVLDTSGVKDMFEEELRAAAVSLVECIRRNTSGSACAARAPAKTHTAGVVTYSPVEVQADLGSDVAQLRSVLAGLRCRAGKPQSAKALREAKQLLKLENSELQVPDRQQVILHLTAAPENTKAAAKSWAAIAQDNLNDVISNIAALLAPEMILLGHQFWLVDPLAGIGISVWGTQHLSTCCFSRCVVVLTRPSMTAVILRLRDRLLGFFDGAEGADAELAADPLLDVVHQYPEEAAWFIKVVMFFGSISGVIISIPCGVFLTMYWDPWMPLGTWGMGFCNILGYGAPCGQCNRPLRYWILVHCILQLLQAPVRLVFFLRLCHVQSLNNNIQECVRQLTHSMAWRTSKVVSIITYGWFILGIVWLLNSTYCKP
eukprot:s2551_g7.t1